MYKEITLKYIEANEEERLTKPYIDENASLIWEDETEQYIIVYWFESWTGVEIVEVKETGSDDKESLLDKLYHAGYIY